MIGRAMIPATGAGVAGPEPSPPAVLQRSWRGGTVVAAVDADRVRVLVAAPATVHDRWIDTALTAVFHQQSDRHELLSVLADSLDEAISRLGGPPVCAMLIEADALGLNVLHRGNPAPLRVDADGRVVVVQPRVPGPPLGSGRGGDVEMLPTGPGDFIVMSTPGLADQVAAAVSQSCPDPSAIWRALGRKALGDPNPGGLALIAPSGILASTGSTAGPMALAGQSA